MPLLLPADEGASARHYDAGRRRARAAARAASRCPAASTPSSRWSKLNEPTLRALAFARAIHPDDLAAVTVRVDPEETDRLLAEWVRRDIPVPLDRASSRPYRDVTRPLLDYVPADPPRAPRATSSAVFIPEYVVGHWWETLLHNQSALRLKARLLFQPGGDGDQRAVAAAAPAEAHGRRGAAAPRSLRGRTLAARVGPRQRDGRRSPARPPSAAAAASPAWAGAGGGPARRCCVVGLAAARAGSATPRPQPRATPCRCCSCCCSWSPARCSAACGWRCRGAVAAALLLNWFFTPPFGTLRRSTPPSRSLVLVVFLRGGRRGELAWSTSPRGATAEAARARAEAEALSSLAGAALGRAAHAHRRARPGCGRCSACARPRCSSAADDGWAVGGEQPRRQRRAGDERRAAGRRRASDLRARRARAGAVRRRPAGAGQLRRRRGRGAARPPGGRSAPPRPRSSRRSTGCAPTLLAGGRPRPAHAAGRDQGRGEQPAPGRRRLDRRGDAPSCWPPSRPAPTGCSALVANLLDASPAAGRRGVDAASSGCGWRSSSAGRCWSAGQPRARARWTSPRTCPTCWPTSAWPSGCWPTCWTTPSGTAAGGASPSAARRPARTRCVCDVVDHGPGRAAEAAARCSRRSPGSTATARAARRPRRRRPRARAGGGARLRRGDGRHADRRCRRPAAG